MPADTLRTPAEIVWARRFVWLYFWLLIFEGALRKWIVPGLANPLLIIRDPVVMLIYLLVALRNRFPTNGFVGTSFVLAIITGVLAMIPGLGHGNLMVMLYGLRTNFLHLPLIFVIPQIFTLNDVRSFGKAVMWVSLPMAVLIVLQFRAPAISRLNAVVGGASGQLIGAMGHVRPSGTFSFVTGVVSFLSLQCAFVIAAFMNREARILRSLSLVALILGLVCSISRAALGYVIVVVMAAGLAIFINPKRIARGALFVGLFVLLGLAVSTTAIFRQGSLVMNARIDDARQGETATQSFVGRMTNDFLSPFKTMSNVSLTGAGTGAGTNVGAGILVGSRGFLLAELEWERLLLESGLIFGIAIIALRGVLTLYLLWWGFRCLQKADNWTPWLLSAAVLPAVFNGSWGQPTMLGFACFGAGLILAATRPTYQQHPVIKHSYRVASVPQRPQPPTS